MTLKSSKHKKHANVNQGTKIAVMIYRYITISTLTRRKRACYRSPKRQVSELKEVVVEGMEMVLAIMVIHVKVEVVAACVVVFSWWE